MSTRVFISRDLSAEDPLLQMLEKDHISVTSASFIQTQAIPFDPEIPTTDWIFFSSRNGVRFFFSQNPQWSQQKFAAIGRGTADELNQFVKVEFCGNHIDTEQVGRTFAQVANNESILFVRAKDSEATVQRFCRAENFQELVVYESILKPLEISYHEVLVFSSPSNVKSFLEKNTISPTQRIIAFGHTTANTLAESGIRQMVRIPTSLKPEDIHKAIMESLLS